jgi:hypothetical protein
MPPDLTLVVLDKRNQDELWGAIEATGLDARTCIADTPRPEDYFFISHISTASHIWIGWTRRFRRGWSRRSVTYEVRTIIGHEDSLTYWDIEWSEVIRAVELWARKVRTYEDATGLWKLPFYPKALGATLEAGSNSPFTETEQAEISRRIREVKLSLRVAFKLERERLERIEEQLDKAEEASRRMGRKDWITLFLGAVTALILTDIITPDVFHHILTLTFYDLGQLFG